MNSVYQYSRNQNDWLPCISFNVIFGDAMQPKQVAVIRSCEIELSRISG